MGGSTVTAGPVVTSAAALVVASATNISGWHDANLLGYATEWTDGAWLTPNPAGYLLQCHHHAPGRLRGQPSPVVCAMTDGRRSTTRGPMVSMSCASTLMATMPGWCASRKPPPATYGPGAQWPAGLSIEPVHTADELADFEAAAAIGF